MKATGIPRSFAGNTSEVERWFRCPTCTTSGWSWSQQTGEGLVHRPVAVAVPGPSHVDQVQRDARVRLLLQSVLRQEGILLPGEHMHLVTLCQRLAQPHAVHRGAGRCTAWGSRGSPAVFSWFRLRWRRGRANCVNYQLRQRLAQPAGNPHRHRLRVQRLTRNGTERPHTGQFVHPPILTSIFVATIKVRATGDVSGHPLSDQFASGRHQGITRIMTIITLEYGSLISPRMAGWKGAHGVAEEDPPFPHGPVAGDGGTAQPTAIEDELASGRLEAHIDQVNEIRGDVAHDTGGRCRGCRPSQLFRRRGWAGHRLHFSVVRPAHRLPGFALRTGRLAYTGWGIRRLGPAVCRMQRRLSLA